MLPSRVRSRMGRSNVRVKVVVVGFSNGPPDEVGGVGFEGCEGVPGSAGSEPFGFDGAGPGGGGCGLSGGGGVPCGWPWGAPGGVGPASAVRIMRKVEL